MNAADLYKEIKDALATFGLSFNEMDKVEVALNDDAIRDLALSIADHGRQEEFHQKRGDYLMYDYHKNERLKMEKQYRALQVHQER